MGFLQWKFTSLAPSSHWFRVKSNRILIVKRAPVMSMFIEGVPLFYLGLIFMSLVKILSCTYTIFSDWHDWMSSFQIVKQASLIKKQNWSVHSTIIFMKNNQLENREKRVKVGIDGWIKMENQIYYLFNQYQHSYLRLGYQRWHTTLNPKGSKCFITE